MGLITHKLRQLIFNPRLRVSSSSLRFRRLGSKYGGWVFVDSSNLENSLIISCGLGEDASFDVDIANEYNLKVLILDPTPRSKIHFEKILNNLGKKNSMPYQEGGHQPITSYDLSKMGVDTLTLIPKAIWTDSKPVRFYSPPNDKNVSHSILNFQNGYSTETSFIEVDAISMKEIIDSHSIQSLPLVKLDIEGAEIEVVHDFLSNGIFPEQILIEYDELNVPSIKSRKRVISTHKKLLEHNYSLVYQASRSDFLYVSENILNSWGRQSHT